MARGNYWEMTYDGDWDGPVDSLDLSALDGSNSCSARRVVNGNPTVAFRWKHGDPERTFLKCDIEADVQDSFITNCTFRLCRFKGSSWRNVKFSNCRFEQCHFSELLVVDCHFVNTCSFVNNSASPETLRISDTAISATAFITAITTNLASISNDADRSYQLFRLTKTREKLAKAVFSATRNEPDVAYFHQAYEQLARCSLDQGVAQHQYDASGKRRGTAEFLSRSFMARVERRVVCSSGWLTKWGQSVLRPLAFFALVTTAFGIIYASAPTTVNGDQPLYAAFIQSLNISLVAGYTSHFNNHDPVQLRVLMLLHLCLGLYWYSLIVPVISRRVLR